MGHMWSAYVTHSDTAPDMNNIPTFDPLYGFPDGRKEREMIATQEEMNAAMLPLDRRDYCAHLYIKYLACKQENPLGVHIKCKHEKHEYDLCEYEDYVLRMKEYERERRLLERAKRKGLRENAETLHA
ncbi:NADH dehydrogenase [ubiquinone] 1 beta subcomplex subunit 7 [Holothuria leucospilota]|uniref:NADH dehydrogenase [ubiquinone] 1 beta subcomplex subunit 7 n=1 Tax=Holothuria leucospilota TaxID=206669 RepID=A0A9Q1H9K1_HOLLE|nr:NADH dehydrogenase [ubiquinone] 1 beta subcomplex subunit 7 [Holothuria leucospilota]